MSMPHYLAPSWRCNLLLVIWLFSSVHLTSCTTRSPVRFQRQLVPADWGASGYPSFNPMSDNYLPPVEQQQLQQQNIYNQQVDDYPWLQSDRHPPVNNVYNTVGTKKAIPTRSYGNRAWPGFGGGKAGGLTMNRPAGVKY